MYFLSRGGNSFGVALRGSGRIQYLLCVRDEACAKVDQGKIADRVAIAFFGSLTKEVDLFRRNIKLTKKQGEII